MHALEMLQELLRAKTVNPPGDEKLAAEIVGSELTAGGLDVETLESPEGRTSVVGRVSGPKDRPALVLLSHLDVVPVEEENWTHDPFGGEIDKGFVWGRGALDMKSIGVMHAGAAIELANSGATPEREVIVVAVADEEAGGEHGARWLLDEHPELVGLEEGRPPPEVIGEGGYGLKGVIERPVIPIVLGEKTAVWLRLIAHGSPGHGALPPDDQAPANLVWALNKVRGYRNIRVHKVLREQFSDLARASSGSRAALFKLLASSAGGKVLSLARSKLATLGALGAAMADTVTPTQLEAGYKHNVVPAKAIGALDCRILPDTDPETFVRDLRSQISKRNVEIEMPKTYTSGPVSDPGPLYTVLRDASIATDGDAVVVPSITPAITDIRFFRTRGATGYGWVPLVLERDLLSTIHGHDERIPVAAFESAVTAMAEVVRRAATTG
jgi:acetylornithine deacetylase/succinyl-diaminopimelate desuccinylase-like protein